MGPVRLQKFLADSGLCSRRAGEAMIAAGEIVVNGEVAHLGQPVTPGVDRIAIHGRTVGGAAATGTSPFTVAVHKPRGVVCGIAERSYPETVFDLLPRALARHRFLPIGRLDPDAEGLVVMTSDGVLADRLARSNQVVRKFVVSLRTPFDRARLAPLVKGVHVGEGTIRVDKAFLLHPGPTGTSSELEIHVSHGRGRGLRELFASLGAEVKRLQCVQIGSLKLRGMPLRGSRVLTTDEVASLFHSD